MNKKVLVLLFVFSFSFFSSLFPTIKADNWWDSSFQYRNVYTIDSDLIDEDLIDFPILVYLNSSYINWTYVQDNLNDLRFVSDYPTISILSHEIDNYTVNSEAWVWVKIPLVTSIHDTYFYLYYCSSIADSVENINDVWSNNYSGVWHMNDETNTTVLDSTLNDNDGTKGSANNPLESVGKIGKSQDFSSDQITVAHNTGLIPNDKITISTWINCDDIAGGDVTQSIVRKGVQYIFGINRSTKKLIAYVTIGGSLRTFLGNTPLNDVTDYYVTYTFDGTTQKLYINNVLDKSDATYNGAMGSDGSTLYIGKNAGFAEYFDGKIDEFEISGGVARSFTWVKADYYSQSNQLISLNYIESFNDEIYGLFLIVFMFGLFGLALILISSSEKIKK